jgi:hypothetical protein
VATFLLLAYVTAVQPVSVKAAPESVRPGDVVLLTIAAADAPIVSVFNRAWPVYREDERSWRALIAIDLKTRPGRHEVVVTQGPSRVVHPIVIARRVFPTRRLTVDPALLNPPPDAMERIARETRELTAVWEASAGERLWDGRFVRPVPDDANSAFGTHSVYNGEPRSQHTGADFLSPSGRPVKAPNAGRVVLASSRYFTGQTVVIDHGQGLFSLFAHLSAIEVKTGTDVAAGDTVGAVGATGRVTGPHLHWTVRLNGSPVDPLSLLRVLGAKPQTPSPKAQALSPR